MIGFVPGDGPLHRAHPFTPFAVAAAVAVLSFVLPSPGGPIVMCLLAVTLAAIEWVPSALWTSVVLAAPFWLFLGLIHWLIRDDPTRALVVASRLTAIIFVSVTAISSVEPARLVEAMVARRLPFSAIFLLTASLQAIPRFADRGRSILDAQRCRGLPTKGGFSTRARAVVPLVVPLVLGSLAELDDRTVALDTRGARAGIARTPLHPPRDSRIDKLVRWGLGLTIVAAVGIRILT